MKNFLLSIATVIAILAIAEFTVGYIVPIRNVGPGFSTDHPQLGKHLKPDASIVRKTPEFTMRLTTNAYGFRGPAIDALPQQPVLFLGDSFTLGYGVNDGQEYPALVGEMLAELGTGDNVDIINTGIGNSGNGRWIKLLETFGAEIQPRLIVMQVFRNDFANNVQEKLFQLSDGGELTALPIREPGTARKIKSIIESVPGLMSTNLFGLIRQVQIQAGGPEFIPPSHDGNLQPGDDLTFAIIEQSLAISQNNQWPVLGLTVGLLGEQQATLDALFAKYGAGVVDIPSKDERPDLYFEVDGHWNDQGHREAAARILEQIGKLGTEFGLAIQESG